MILMFLFFTQSENRNMPKPVQSFIAEHTRGDRKVFDTLDACLFEETKALHEDLIRAVTFLCFVDGVPIDSQFDKLRSKFTALRDKAREWQAARAARAEEFAQRKADDIADQKAYWAQFYANQERIARAINRDIARREQRRADDDAVELPTLPELTTESAPDERAEPTRPVCDICGKPMIRKTGKFGKFLACSGYPACKHTRPLPTPLAEPAETPAERPVDMRRAA